jgi:hypothetical protein
LDYLLPPFLAALSSLPVPALPWPARVAIRRERRADRLTSGLDYRRVRPFMAVGGTPPANPRETTGLALVQPTFAAHGIAAETKTALNALNREFPN